MNKACWITVSNYLRVDFEMYVMRKMFALGVILLFATSGIAQNRDILLNKKWVIEAHEVGGTRTPVPSQAGDGAVLHDSGVYESVDNGQLITGKWSLESDRLTVVDDRSGAVTTFYVVSLSDDEFIVRMSGKSGVTDVVMKAYSH